MAADHVVCSHCPYCQKLDRNKTISRSRFQAMICNRIIVHERLLHVIKWQRRSLTRPSSPGYFHWLANFFQNINIDLHLKLQNFTVKQR